MKKAQMLLRVDTHILPRTPSLFVLDMDPKYYILQGEQERMIQQQESSVFIQKFLSLPFCESD